MDSFLQDIATSLNISESQRTDEVAKWQKAFGTHCTTVDNLRELVGDKTSWERVSKDLDPMVEKRIRDKCTQNYLHRLERFLPVATKPVYSLTNCFWYILIFSRSYTECVYLDIPDILKKNGAMTSAQLAEATKTHTDPIRHIMRCLSAFGVFDEHKDGTYTVNPFSEAMCADHPFSQKDYIKVSKMFWELAENLDQGIKQDTDTCQLTWKRSYYEHFAVNPELKQQFSNGMRDMSKPETAELLKAYDFSKFKKIIDVGGSSGHILKSILKQQSCQNVHGVVFDLPSVIDYAKQVAEKEGHDWKGRLEFVGGDFTKEVPVGDCYWIKYCVHNTTYGNKDGKEDTAVTLLKACHRAAPSGAKLLLCELILCELGEQDPERRFDHCMDLLMLVFFHAKERTLSEYKELGLAGGWKLVNTYPVGGTVLSLHVIEFEKV